MIDVSKEFVECKEIVDKLLSEEKKLKRQLKEIQKAKLEFVLILSGLKEVM